MYTVYTAVYTARGKEMSTTPTLLIEYDTPLPFYLRDALLAPVLALCLCLSVSVCHKLCSIETAGRINLVLAWRLLLTSPTLCFKEIQVPTKIRVLPSGTFFSKLWTLKISPRHIDRRTCYQLSSRKVDAHSVINWTVVGQLS